MILDSIYDKIRQTYIFLKEEEGFICQLLWQFIFLDLVDTLVLQNKNGGENMRTAIDRLYLGTEKEVDIYDFDGYKQDNRFVCPECSEYVFPAVGKRNAFKHYKKKDVECNRRVDGQTSFTYYERVGLPLYLQKSGSTFLLKMGFPPLKKPILDAASSKKVKLTITSGVLNSAEKATYYLDNRRFSCDSASLLTIDFVPDNNKNYCISLSDKVLEKQILEAYSNYADGFATLGALFSCTESGGKKIRKNDTIEVNITYYWMIPSGRYKERSGLTANYVSTIELGKKSFDIYIIIVRNQSESEFRSLASFFWDFLKVRLLYIKPEIIPLWPPTIETDQCLICTQSNIKSSAVFCSIKSDNEKPIIYQYADKNYKEVSVHGKKNQAKWTTIVLSQIIQPFTIDRKYLANGITLSLDMPLLQLTQPELLICLNGEEITDRELVLEKVPAELSFFSDKPMVLLCCNKNQSMQAINLNPNETNGFQFNINVYEYWLFDKISGNILCKIKSKSTTTHKNNVYSYDEILIPLIRKCLSEPTIPIPRKDKDMVMQLLKHPTCYEMLLPAIRKGRIQPTILKMIVLGGTINE